MSDNYKQYIQGELETFDGLCEMLGVESRSIHTLVSRHNKSLTNLTRHILEEQIKMVEGLRITGLFNNRDGAPSLQLFDKGHDLALDTIRQSLQEQLAELNK